MHCVGHQASVLQLFSCTSTAGLLLTAMQEAVHCLTESCIGLNDKDFNHGSSQDSNAGDRSFFENKLY